MLLSSPWRNLALSAVSLGEGKIQTFHKGDANPMQQETPRQWNVESKGMVGLTVLLILLALVLFSGMAHAAIEDVLYESGKISKEEWLKIKAEREREEAEREKQIKEAVDRAITRDVKKRKWIDAVVWSGDLRLRYGQF